MHWQISHYTGFNSTSDRWLKIPQRHYNAPPYIYDYTNAYPKHRRRFPNIIEPPQAIVPTKIFQEGWSKMKERTSAGISGLDFGHLKACLQSPLLSYFEDLLSRIPYTTGYAPEYWKIHIFNSVKERIRGPHIKSKDHMPYGGRLWPQQQYPGKRPDAMCRKRRKYPQGTIRHQEGRK